MNYIFVILIILFIILLFSIYFYKNHNKEHFYITTWTPYIIDVEYQPGFSNYFYNNGYMYPIY